LVGGGDAACPPEVLRTAGVFVEDGQVVVGVTGNRMTVDMGSRLPVAVTACPQPDSNSCRVAETMMVVGRPLCCPS
jgi:hypothetical protein